MTFTLGTGALLFTLCYLLILIGIAVVASLRSRKRSSHELEEHELGGRNLPLLVLLGTLYASQYSGNSFVGFTGKAAREGYHFLVSPLIMQAIVVCYLIYAPRLFKLSRLHGFRTPSDILVNRYQYKPLQILASVIMVFALLNFILSQLVAIGKITKVLSIAGTEATGIHPAWGIFSLAILMVVYENVGGMRAVAWTDMLQGFVLLLAIMGLMIVLETQFGGMTQALHTFVEQWPKKVSPPTGTMLASWLGTTIMLGVGGAMYPHAIQRIYAARSELVLKRSLAIMVFLPLITTLPIFLIGIKAQSLYGKDQLVGDQAMPFILNELATKAGPITSLLVLLVLAGAVSAMMSTADSALLTTSSIVNRDFLERYLLLGRSVKFRLLSGKMISWIIVLPLASLATWCVAAGYTIWDILSIKLELLLQTAPAIMIGVHTQRLRGSFAFFGMLSGTLFTLALWLLEMNKLAGIQAGVWGFGINLLICGVGLCCASRKSQSD